MSGDLFSLAGDLGFERKRFIQAVHGLQATLTTKFSSVKNQNELTPIVQYLENLVRSTERMTAITQTLELELYKEKLVSVSDFVKNIQAAVFKYSINFSKKIKFLIKDANVEIDQELLNSFEKILIQILEPMIEFGIESENERQARFKNLTTTFELSFKSVIGGHQIIITYDGNGIVPPRIFDKSSLLANVDVRGNFEGTAGQKSVWIFFLPKKTGSIRVLPLVINQVQYCIPAWAVTSLEHGWEIEISTGFQSKKIKAQEVFEPFDSYIKKLDSNLSVKNTYSGVILHQNNSKNEEVLSLVLNPAKIIEGVEL